MNLIYTQRRNSLHRFVSVVVFLLFVFLFNQTLITTYFNNGTQGDEGKEQKAFKTFKASHEASITSSDCDDKRMGPILSTGPMDEQGDKRNESVVDLQKTKVTSDTPKFLPAFCVRCTSKSLKEEFNQQEQCDIIENNKISWMFYKNNYSSESFVPEWYLSWAEYRKSFPIVKIDPATNKTEFVKELTDFDPELLYARYLVAPSLLSKDLQYDSTYWRLNLTSSIFTRMDTYEFPFEYWSLYYSWNSGQEQRFEKRHPWYEFTTSVYCEDRKPQAESNVSMHVYSQWKKLADALYLTGERLWERFSYNDASTPDGYDKQVLPSVKALLERYLVYIQSKRGLVLGSQTPWLEHELWRKGVAHITTIDYLDLGQAIPANHPRMRYMNSTSLDDQMASSRDNPYDFAMAYSSIEHIGLGRYNDPLNPDGDLMELGKLSCLVKPGGFLFIAVPPVATDCMVFNLHRLYGPIRYSMLTECWKIVEFQSFNASNTDCDPPQVKCEFDPSFIHPWFVLQNLRGCSIDN